MAPTGAWLWGSLGWQPSPWPGMSPGGAYHQCAQEKCSLQVVPGQGGWKKPNHIALPSTDAQVASRTFPAPGSFGKPSYGWHVHTGRWSRTVASEISPRRLPKNLIGSNASTPQHPCSAFAPRLAPPWRHQVKASVGWRGTRKGDTGVSGCWEPVTAP